MKKRLVSIMLSLIIAGALTACSDANEAPTDAAQVNADQADTAQADTAQASTDSLSDMQKSFNEESKEELNEEIVVTIVSTDIITNNDGTHSTVTTYSDNTTTVDTTDDCTYDNVGVCTVCHYELEIADAIVTEFENVTDYVVVGTVPTYSTDSIYREVGTIGTENEVTILKVTGTTENGWLVTDNGFVKPEDITERNAYEEVNGNIYTVTYFDEAKTLFCQEYSNIRIKPENSADVSYAKGTNDTVTVVGTCNENGWYLLEDGNWTLKSNLGENKVIIAPPVNTETVADNNTTVTDNNSYTSLPSSNDRPVVYDPYGNPITYTTYQGDNCTWTVPNGFWIDGEYWTLSSFECWSE